jgi:hypothetical protein
MKNRREVVEAGVHGCLGAIAAAAAASGATASAEAGGATASAEEKPAPQRFLLVGLCGSENPTRANFPFVWAAALKESGNDVRIELAGDGTVLMRNPVANSVTPVGWPPFREALARVVDYKIPIFV